MRRRRKGKESLMKRKKHNNRENDELSAKHWGKRSKVLYGKAVAAAASGGCPEIVKLLILKGFKVDYPFAIKSAIKRNHPHIVLLLFSNIIEIWRKEDKGLPEEARDLFENKTIADYRHPGTYEQPMKVEIQRFYKCASKYGSIESFRIILQVTDVKPLADCFLSAIRNERLDVLEWGWRKESLFNPFDKDGRAFKTALESGRISVLDLFFKHDQDEKEMKRLFGKSGEPYKWAVKANQVMAVLWLLKHGCPDPDVALLTACEDDNQELMKWLCRIGFPQNEEAVTKRVKKNKSMLLDLIHSYKKWPSS